MGTLRHIFVKLPLSKKHQPRQNRQRRQRVHRKMILMRKGRVIMKENASLVRKVAAERRSHPWSVNAVETDHTVSIQMLVSIRIAKKYICISYIIVASFYELLFL